MPGSGVPAGNCSWSRLAGPAQFGLEQEACTAEPGALMEPAPASSRQGWEAGQSTLHSLTVSQQKPRLRSGPLVVFT